MLQTLPMIVKIMVKNLSFIRASKAKPTASSFKINHISVRPTALMPQSHLERVGKSSPGD